MQDKCHATVYGAAIMQGYVAEYVVMLQVEFVEQCRYRAFGMRLVDDQAEGPVTIVLDNVDHGLRKAGVTHLLGRDEQLTCHYALSCQHALERLIAVGDQNGTEQQHTQEEGVVGQTAHRLSPAYDTGSAEPR